MDATIIIDTDYAKLIQDLKQAVRGAQLKAHRAVNSELIQLYWKIGKELHERQKVEKWGAKYLEQVSRDLANAFPSMKGLSRRSLELMRQFYSMFTGLEIAKQPISQLAWGSVITLIQKLKNKEVISWYSQEAIKNGWSRNVLSMMIKSDLYARQAEAPKITNFQATLPALQSDMAHELFKDPYNFEFLNLNKAAHERDIEEALVINIRDFLLRLGKGFAFVGNQYKIEVGGDEFFIDMLFFNMDLNCYVVIELKTGKFSPADSGQLKFYLTAVNKLVKKDHHAPTIGILLCENKNEVVAEFALEGVNEPMGISQYELGAALTQHLKMVGREQELLSEKEPANVT
jgi:predicted nuclease of restriction endonuclease-like (RecB) superfamily